MKREMAEYTSLMPRLLPQCVPAPNYVLLDALQLVGVDFCTRTRIWRETLYESLSRGDTELPLMLRGRIIVQVQDVRLDGMHMKPGVHYDATPAGVVLASPACRDMEAVIVSSVRPSRMSTHFPAALLEEWGDVLCFGVLAKVKSMTGPRVEWTDAAGAELNLGLYEQGVARARIALTRGYDRRPLHLH